MRITPQRTKPGGQTGIEDIFDRIPTVLRRGLFQFALVGIVLFVAIAVVLSWRQYEGERSTATQNVRARAVLAATVFDTFFSGLISTLQGMAEAPAVVDGDRASMQAYFERVARSNPTTFAGGYAWIDSRGVVTVSGAFPTMTGRSVADRSYFRSVMKTGKPFVSESLVGKVSKRLVTVVAVPTHDRDGHVTGVLTGSWEPARRSESTPSKSAIELGYEGLAVLDRLGQNVVLPTLDRPRNSALLDTLMDPRARNGVLTDTRGLDGRTGHLVGYAVSRVPGWVAVIDRPRTEVFAAARRGLAIDLSFTGLGALVILGLLFWTLRRARAGARSAQADFRVWTRLTEDFASAHTSSDVARALVDSLAARFDDVDVTVALAAPDADRLTTWTDSAGSPLRDIAELGFELADLLERVYESGAATNVPHPPIRRRSGERVSTLFVAPLATADHAALGAIGILFYGNRTISEAEAAIVAWKIDRAAQALERTHVQEVDHDIAMTLQQNLLPDRLPATEGVDVVGRYRPGGRGLAVGGDWYDVVKRPDGILHVSVGDVAGHGIEAAANMGNLRSAFRAYAFEGLSPAGILSRLNRHLVGENAMATAICLTFDPLTRELTYASAGHPPAVLFDAAGNGRHLSASAPPLGYSGHLASQDAALTLGPASIVLVYTDGLVERRRTDITVGISQVNDIIARHAAMGADAIADAVLEELGPLDKNADDVALLVLEVLEVPERMDVQMPSDDTMLAALVRRVVRWATISGLGTDEIAAAGAAVLEAYERAAEPVADGFGTPRWITLVVADGAVEVDSGEPPVTRSLH